MSTQIEEKQILTDEEQSVIDQLVELQAESRNGKQQPKSDAEFCRDLSINDSTWNLIKSGKYWSMVKNRKALIIKLETDLRNITTQKALAARFGSKQFIELNDFSAVFSAIEEAKNKPLSDPDRYIAYLAETGGGKSALGGECARRYNATLIEQRDSWRKSRGCILRETAMKIGARGIDKIVRPDQLEDEVLKVLRQKNMVLFFDEGEFTGRHVLNLFKLILNQTKTVIVHGCNPLIYHKLRHWYPHEFDQIKRRTHLLVEQNAIMPDDIKKFLKPLDLDLELGSATIAIAGAANTFGRYDFIVRILDALKEERGRIAHDHLAKIIATTKAKMGKEGK